MTQSFPVPTSANRHNMALLMADTDAIKAYVFESNKLPEIRGASRQLTDLNAQIGKLIPAANRIYANGGGMLAFVPQAEAQALVAQIETLYPQETGAATITAVARPLPPDYTDDQFGDVVTWLSYLLRQRKESKAAPPFWETLPHQVRCVSCLKRPASAEYVEKWCPICHSKRAYQRRDAWFNDFAASIPADALYWNEQRDAATYPQDLGEIGAASHPQAGYIGFIYLDGDRIGRLLQEEIKTPNAYKQFSDKMVAVTKTAVFNALSTNLQLTQVPSSPSRAELDPTDQIGDNLWIHPFDIITIGGDDVLLIVPAHAALPIALAIGKQFGEEMTAFVQGAMRIQREISMSGGVVIAEHHTPVRVLYDLSEQLQKEAKKQARDLPKGGAIDFLVLKSSDMLDSQVSQVCENYPYTLSGGDRKHGKDLRLLGRPYSYPKLEILWRDLSQLKASKKFANSQMHLLAQSLLDGRSSSTLFFAYQQKRDKDGAYDTLRALLSSLQTTGDDHPFPWEKITGDDASYQTALWDIAELYDFIPA